MPEPVLTPRARGPWLTRAVALVILAGLYAAARMPPVAAEDVRLLAARFRFTPIAVPDPPGAAPRTTRGVHPALRHLQAWASSMGASAALTDLDGDGAPNDLCAVDPRFDAVLIRPVPGTGERYAPFVLTETTPGSPVVPTGCLAGDVDEDGRMDVLVYYWGRTPIAFLRRDAGTLARDGYRPVEIGPEGEVWNTNAMTLADLDGDGHQDLVVGNFFPDGEVPFDPRAGSAITLPRSMSRAYNGGRNRLLLWRAPPAGDEPALRFEDVSSAIDENGLRGWTHAVGAADLDGDGLVELYFGNDFGPDRLLHNRSRPGQVRFAELRGRRGWTTPMSRVIGLDTFKGMGVDFGDLNGDGVLDLYVSNIAIPSVAVEGHFLFASEGPMGVMKDGIAPFVDRAEAMGLSLSGWAWDCKLADFDNDGALEAVQTMGFLQGTIDRWPELQELLVANDELVPRPAVWPRMVAGDDISGSEPDAFFTRDERGVFVDVAPALGLDGAAVPTRGVAIADVDLDGDLDFVFANQWSAFVFYRNDAPLPGDFLGLRLVFSAGESAARTAAVGASVAVTDPAGRRHVSFIDGGSGHSGRRSQDAHIGLGRLAADAVLATEITWRGAAGLRRARLPLRPGWHTIRLDPDGRAVPVP